MHDLHIYASSTYSRNEILQNINCCVINQNAHYMQCLAGCVATFLFLSLQHLV